MMVNYESLIQIAKDALVKAETLGKNDAAKLLKKTQTEVSFECFQIDMVAPIGQTLRSTENVFIAYRKWLEQTIEIVTTVSEQGVINNIIVIIFNSLELADELIEAPEASDVLKRSQELVNLINDKIPYWLYEVITDYYRAITGRINMLNSGYKPYFRYSGTVEKDEEDLIHKYENFGSKISELGTISRRIVNDIYAQGHNYFTFEGKDLSSFSCDTETEVLTSSYMRDINNTSKDAENELSPSSSFHLGKILVLAILLLLLIAINTEPLKPTKSYRFVEAKSLRVRSEPTTNSSIINQLTVGDKVEVKETTNGWLFVVNKDVSGWVAAKYISPPEPK